MSRPNQTVVPEDQFHDSSLLRVDVNISLNSAELEIRTHSHVMVLRAEQITALTLGRAMPWGPSQSINRVSVTELDKESSELMVELQSGDELHVTARRFVLR